MNDILNYKGYEIVSRHNNKINARIKNNRYVSQILGLLGANLEYESSITFVFTNYDTMVKFMDENPR